MSHSVKSTLQVFIAIVFMFGAFGTMTLCSRLKRLRPNVVIEVKSTAAAAILPSKMTSSNFSTWAKRRCGLKLHGLCKIPRPLVRPGPRQNLTGTIQPGAYLVQEAWGLEAPWFCLGASGTIAMSGSHHQVAPGLQQTALTGAGSPTGTGVVDFVGYSCQCV